MSATIPALVSNDRNAQVYKQIYLIGIGLLITFIIIYNLMLKISAEKLGMGYDDYKHLLEALPVRTGGSNNFNAFLIFAFFLLVQVIGLLLNRSVGPKFAKPFSLTKENLHKTPEQLGMSVGIVSGRSAALMGLGSILVLLILIIILDSATSFQAGMQLISQAALK